MGGVGERSGGDDGFVRLGIAADFLGGNGDETLLREAFQGRGGAFPEIGHGHRPLRCVEQNGEDGVLFGRAFLQFCDRLRIGIRHGGGDAAGLR